MPQANVVPESHVTHRHSIVPETESTRRCTGPRTREGKQKASQNSTKHGCCSKRLLLPDEDPEEFEALKAGWLQSYNTPDPVSLKLVLAAAEAQWQLTRAQNAFDKAQYAIYEEQPDCTLWTEEHHKLYAKFQRYQSAAERTSNAPSRMSSACAAPN